MKDNIGIIDAILDIIFTVILVVFAIKLYFSKDPFNNKKNKK